MLVGLDGLEPSTSVLSGPRSNRLSYRPPSVREALSGAEERREKRCPLIISANGEGDKGRADLPPRRAQQRELSKLPLGG